MSVIQMTPQVALMEDGLTRQTQVHLRRLLAVFPSAVQVSRPCCLTGTPKQMRTLSGVISYTFVFPATSQNGNSGSVFFPKKIQHCSLFYKHFSSFTNILWSISIVHLRIQHILMSFVFKANLSGEVSNSQRTYLLFQSWFEFTSISCALCQNLASLGPANLKLELQQVICNSASVT